jgi:anti-sigma regulatory factor (Ser/Thr protein kinase)
MISTQNCKQLAVGEYFAKADQLKILRQMVRACLEREGCKKEFIQKIVLVVNEACMNIIQHAYALRETEVFKLEIRVAGKDLLIVLTDSAPTVDINDVQSRDLDDIRPGGLGVHIMSELMDSVEFRGGDNGHGNILQLKKTIEYI